MQIEVTEKEAKEIYSQRHWGSLGKKKYLPLIIFVIAVVVSFTTYSADRQWWSLAILIVVSSPAIYMTLKSARASGKYAKSQIEEQK